MLCNKCPAKITKGCFISKGKFTRCNRTEEEINRIRDILLLSHKLDEIATRYNSYHNEEDKILWYKILMENS